MSTDYEAQALNQIPGYPELLSARDRLKRRDPFHDLLPKPIAVIEAVDAIVARVLAGADVGPLVVDRLGDPQKAEQMAEQANGMLRLIRERVDQRLERARLDGTDVALRWLGSELDAVLAGLGPRRDAVLNIGSADQAIKAGPAGVEAWRTFSDAQDHYLGIRDAQARIFMAGWLDTGDPGLPGEVLARHAIVEDGPVTMPTGVVMNGTTAVGSERQHPVAAWPAALGDQLLWALSSGYRLWVPDRPQVRASMARVAELRRQQLEALDDGRRAMTPTQYDQALRNARGSAQCKAEERAENERRALLGMA